MTKPLFHAIELESHRPVGPPRNSIQFARSDAIHHFRRTAFACAVVRLEIIWTSAELEEVRDAL